MTTGKRKTLTWVQWWWEGVFFLLDLSGLARPSPCLVIRTHCCHLLFKTPAHNRICSLLSRMQGAVTSLWLVWFCLIVWLVWFWRNLPFLPGSAHPLRPSCFPHLASVCGHLFCKAPTQPAPCWIHAFLRCLQTLYPCTKAMVFLDFPWLVWVFSCSSHFLQNWDAIIWSSYSSSSLFWITDASHFLFLSVGGFPWVLDWVCFIYSWESFLFESTAWGCLWDLENHFIFFLESPILQTCLALDVKD